MLYTTPVSELNLRLGLPMADSYRLKAMFELSERRKIHEVITKPKISRSEDVYQLFQHLSSSPYEEFWILLLSRANRIIDRIKISEGGVSGTVVDPKKIFHHALKALASGLILVHNHPSGNLEPSEADMVNRVISHLLHEIIPALCVLLCVPKQKTTYCKCYKWLILKLPLLDLNQRPSD